MISRVSPARRFSSGPGQGTGPIAQARARSSPGGRKRSGSTDGSSAAAPAAEENGIERRSRSPRVFAMFARMRKIQVLREERRARGKEKTGERPCRDHRRTVGRGDQVEVEPDRGGGDDEGQRRRLQQ